MKRVGFQFKVRPDKLEEYKKRHKDVWPEMLAALSESGWHNYTLFAREDGTIFGYFETESSLADALAKMGATEINAKWQDSMAQFTFDDGHPDEDFFELQEYFHLD